MRLVDVCCTSQGIVKMIDSKMKRSNQYYDYMLMYMGPRPQEMFARQTLISYSKAERNLCSWSLKHYPNLILLSVTALRSQVCLHFTIQFFFSNFLLDLISIIYLFIACTNVCCLNVFLDRDENLGASVFFSFDLLVSNCKMTMRKWKIWYEFLAAVPSF